MNGRLQDIHNRCARILIRDFGVAASDVVDGACLIDDLGLDSLDTVELAVDTEEEFGIEISDEEIESAQTFGDLKAIVDRRLPQ